MDGPGRPEPGHEHEHEQSNTNSVQLFEFVTPPEKPFEAYSRRAHVSSKASIEVVAVVKADNSPFLLGGDSGVVDDGDDGMTRGFALLLPVTAVELLPFTDDLWTILVTFGAETPGSSLTVTPIDRMGSGWYYWDHCWC